MGKTIISSQFEFIHLAAFREKWCRHFVFPIHFSHRGRPDGKNEIVFPILRDHKPRRIGPIRDCEPRLEYRAVASSCDGDWLGMGAD